MAHAFLTSETIFQIYQDSKTHTEVLTRPFPEFERIARNRPHDNIDPAYPKTTDGTTASIVRKTPKRIVQQLPTGKVITDDEGWLGIVADYIYNHKILLQANHEYNLIQKAWLVIENGLTFGSCMTYTPFMEHDGEFGPDMSIPYWGDIAIQRGKKSGEANSYTFLRSWWQKADIEALIEAETKRTKANKKDKEYTPTWDIVGLQTVLEAQTSKDAIATTPSDKDRGISATAVELVTGFQKGVGAEFITFNPASKTIVRTKINKDPRGKMPLNWMYGDIDGNNPLGRGVVELIGGLQNLIDSDMQMYQFNRAMALAPPVIKYGNIGSFKYAPNVVINARNDPNAKIVPLVIDTSAIINYPALYGLQKSQLLNLVNSPDTSVSSTIGNPGFSKTSAGVNQQQAIVSVDDNFIRKMFEVWFQDWSEGAINMYFAEHFGIEELQLDKATAQKLRELPNFNESLINDKNQIQINYDTDTPSLKFRVDPSTTSVKDASAQIADATNLLDMVMKYSILNSNFGGPIDIDVLARRIVNNSGIDDPEQVAPEPTEAQKQSKEQQKNTVSPFSPMFDKPTIRMNYPDLPMAAQIQVLGSAGVHVTPEDMMQGPVLDPNMRGTMNPINDPNLLIPGGGQAQQSTPGQAPGMGQGQANPLQQDGINLTQPEIQRLLQDPRFAQLPPEAQQQMVQQAQAQTQQQPQAPQAPQQTVDPKLQQADQMHQMNMMAKGQDMIHKQDMHQMAMDKGTQDQLLAGNPMSHNTNNPLQAEDAQEPQGQQDDQLNPADQQIIAHLQALGIPEATIQQAIQMLEDGATADQVLQAIGVSQGAM